MPRPSEPESFITIPKRKAGIFIPAATLGVALSVLGAAERGCKWLDERQRAARAEALEQEHLYDRIRSLERWRCAIGGRPPETIDWNRPCPVIE